MDEEKWDKGYIIAEIGVNHFDIAKEKNISAMEAAKLMIKEAKINGANAAKFQSYKASKIVSKNSPAYWDTTKEKTKSQHELFLKYDHFNEQEYIELSKYCNELNIDFMSTPFDLEAVEFLDNLQNIFKIASADITNIPLLKKVAKKNKTIILSTGASTIEEIHYAVDIIKNINSEVEICLLHCVLSYPTNNKDANLKRINFLQNEFPNIKIGYSDHTLPSKGMAIVTAAYVNGAKIIEKHFTLNKELPGNDHYHAMDSNDLKIFRENIDIINQAYSKFDKDYLPCEEIPRKQARRSLILTRNMKSGEVIKEGDLICKRPGTGIETKDLTKVVGKIVNKNLEEDHILQWSDLE